MRVTLAREAAQAGETVAALSGDGLVGVLADTLRELPGVGARRAPRRSRQRPRSRRSRSPPIRPAPAACIAEGNPRPMDLGLVEQLDGDARARASWASRSAGFDSDANRIANEAPPWLGGLVYAYGALRALLSWRPARFELELDDGAPAHLHAGTPSRSPTPARTAAGCTPRPTRCSTTGCSTSSTIEDVSSCALPEGTAPRVQGHARRDADRARVSQLAGHGLSRPAFRDVRRRRPGRLAAGPRERTERRRDGADAGRRRRARSRPERAGAPEA